MNRVRKTFCLLALAMFGVAGMTAQEAYAVYTSDNTTLTFYYDTSRSTRTLSTETVYDLNTGMNKPDWYTDGKKEFVEHVVFDASFAYTRPTCTFWWFAEMTNLSDITGIQYLNTANVTYMNKMFYNCKALTSLDLSSFNTENVTNMSEMFFYCSNLTSLNVSNFNTAKVTTMFRMFDGCSKLTSLDLSSFNTSSVKTMESMFTICTNLTNLNVSSFNTENATNMSSMFYDCNALTSLDVSSFNTEKVTNMSCMFYECNALTSLDVSSFNTEKVTDMSFLFYGCSSLTNLDVKNFNTSKVSNMNSMFHKCSSLQTIYVGANWSVDNVTTSNYMFTESTSLVGGAGTAFNSSHIDKTYAHIDGGTADPGYFTAKLSYQQGDVNMDGAVNVSDVNLLVSMILGNTTQNDMADVNGDGAVNVSDVTLLVSMILGNN